MLKWRPFAAFFYIVAQLALSAPPAFCADPAAGKSPERPLTLSTLHNVVLFIRAQRGLNGTGLPATFFVPKGALFTQEDNRLIVSEGVGLYDTSLAIIALVEAGHLTEARSLLDIYASGLYGPDREDPMELRAYPNGDNQGAFAPFDASAYYFFDFTNVHGHWLRWAERWKFWSVHTGPNAWLANATALFIDASRRAGQNDVSLRRYLLLANTLGKALRRLQNSGALGGIRYGPMHSYHDPDQPAPYDQLNMENNLSSYMAFSALYRVTRDPAYAKAARNILFCLRYALVWTADGRPRRGFFDAKSQTLSMGAENRNGRWVLQEDHPTDAGGTWAISALGPAKIDQVWGRGTAYRMWREVRRRAGRTRNFKYAGDSAPLAGLDYNDSYPPNESLISPEWTAGGLFALRALIAYYGRGKNRLPLSAVAAMRRDMLDMEHFILDHSSPYCVGPGHHGTRRGKTGFGWSSPPPDVYAMASIYFALFTARKDDPMSWWRDLRGKRPGLMSGRAPSADIP